MDVHHPSTAVCQSCGLVMAKEHRPMRLEDMCKSCHGYGFVDIKNKDCGHIIGRVLCDECGGSGFKDELTRIREGDHS